MITVSEKGDELIIDGTMENGDIIKGLCCAGFDCDVVHIFRDKESSNDDSVWYGCNSPSHDPERGDGEDDGIGHQLVEDIALWMLDNV